MTGQGEIELESATPSNDHDTPAQTRRSSRAKHKARDGRSQKSSNEGNERSQTALKKKPGMAKHKLSRRKAKMRRASPAKDGPKTDQAKDQTPWSRRLSNATRRGLHDHGSILNVKMSGTRKGRKHGKGRKRPGCRSKKWKPQWSKIDIQICYT